jgi:hypothetical protein
MPKSVLFSIPEPINNQLNKIQQESGYTKSSMVTTALQLYFLLYHGDKAKTDVVMSLIDKNQTDIYEFLKDK